MLIEDIIPEPLDEGPHDPSIYKAVFLAGGPGSGKSYVVDNSALQSMGFKIVNNDAAFEKFLSNAGMEANPENIYSRQGQEIRSRAKSVTNKQMQNYMKGNLGLVIDGTGKDLKKIESQAQKLKAAGYDAAMIFVNTDLETAQARNRMRARTIPDEEVERMWSGVQKNIGAFQGLFGTDMYIVDNSEDADTSNQIMKIYKNIKKWAKEPSRKPR